MNKKLLLILACCLIIGTLTGCSTETDVVKNEDKPQETAQDIEQEEEINSKDEELLEKILVSYEVDSIAENGKQIMQVDIKNTTDKIFTGDIHVYFEDKNGKEIGYDMMIIEDLKPGNTTFCNINVEAMPKDDINIDYSFSDDYEFTDDIAEGELNEELTTKITADLKDSFGNEYHTTNWYPSIKSIEVYSTDDEVNYIIATATSDGEEIGNIIFGNYVFKEDAECNKVIVKDEENNVVFTKSK